MTAIEDIRKLWRTDWWEVGPYRYAAPTANSSHRSVSLAPSSHGLTGSVAVIGDRNAAAIGNAAGPPRFALSYTLQMSVNGARSLADLRPSESGRIERIEFEDGFRDHLMLMGFLPGAIVEAGTAAPGGDPRVYRVDGTEIALRRETALRLILG
jgi:ferrous iron transport protein A